jgi:hypothetical protein
MVPIVAIFLQPMQDFLIRLQEGNWPSSLAPLSRLLCRWHIYRRKRVVQSIDRKVGSDDNPDPFTQLILEVQRYPEYRVERLKRFLDHEVEGDVEGEVLLQALFKVQQYPNESHMMPTRLGNVLRAEEDRAGQRYGLSTVDVWPRLYQLLPQRLIDSASDARNELELSLRFSGTFFLAGTSSFVLMFQHGLWLLVPIVWLLSAWLSYQTAIRAAAQYGEAVKLAFDLHRFDLLRALHVPLPTDAKQELLINRRLSESLQYSQNIRFAYQHEYLS